MLRILIAILLFGLTFVEQTNAKDWSGKAEQEISETGQRLKNARTVEERVAALRDIQRIADANPDNEGARLLAKVASSKANQEAGAKAIVDALADYAKSGKVRDADTLRSFLTPLLASLSDMYKDGTLFPKAVVELNDALKKLDSVVKKAGLPRLVDFLEDPFGDDIQTPKALDFLSKLANIVKAYGDLKNIDKLDSEARKKAIDNWMSFVPPGLSPALYGPAYIAFRDQIVWSADGWDLSSEGLGLVTDAMRTGKLDKKKFAKVEEKLKKWSKGPWNEKTLADMTLSMCKLFPVAKDWCDDIFKAAENLVKGYDCEAITCDCAHAGSGGIANAGIIVQCKIQEASLISMCQKQEKMTKFCSVGISGPGATIRLPGR